MITKSLSAGLAGLFLLGSGDAALAHRAVGIDGMQIELEACETTRVQGLRADHAKITEVCAPTHTVLEKGDTPLKLRVFLSTRGQPVAGKQVRLTLGCEAGCESLLARSSGALIGTTDAAGEVAFDALYFRRAVPFDAYLFITAEEEDGSYVERRYPVVRAPSEIISAQGYVLYTNPPTQVWTLSYDGGIPAGATVRWNVRTREGLVISGGEFTTAETSDTLTIESFGLVCDGSGVNAATYHDLSTNIEFPQQLNLASVIKLRGACASYFDFGAK